MVAVVVLLSAFPIMAWPDVLDNADSAQTDQEDFLLLGQDIRAGVRWSDGNRHPLLPAVLSPLASTDWSYFSSAKLLNLGLALLLVVLLLWLNGRLFGIDVALLSVALTVFNPDFRDTSVRVVAEPLMAVFFLLTFYLWYRSISQPELTRRERVWALVLAGACAGLGYLTKGTSQLLVIGVAAWWALSGRWKDNAIPVTGFIIAYLAIIAPLLAYNLHAWGNPLYNFNSTHAMWLDSWDDVWLPSVSLTTFQSYLASHAPWEMLNRLVSGGLSLIEKRGDVFLPAYSVAILAVSVVIGVTAPGRAVESTLMASPDLARKRAGAMAAFLRMVFPHLGQPPSPHTRATAGQYRRRRRGVAPAGCRRLGSDRLPAHRPVHRDRGRMWLRCGRLAGRAAPFRHDLGCLCV